VPYLSPNRRPRGFHAARAIDIVVATCAIVMLMPLLLVRAVAGRLSVGRWVDLTPALGLHCRVIGLQDFAGPWPGRSLARLHNLLTGDVALAGPRPARIGERARWLRDGAARFSVRPGLVTPGMSRALMGLEGPSDAELEASYGAQHGAFSNAAVALRWALARCVAGPASRPAPPILNILGVTLVNSTLREAVDWLADRARARRRTFVAFANADCLNTAHEQLVYRRVLQRADRVFADGSGVRIGARLLGQKMTGNVNGTDLFPELCARAARDGLKLFFLGALPGVAEAAASAMSARFAALQIAGVADGYFSAQEEPAVIERINASGADILLVALGAPSQELWLSRNESALVTPVRLGVGGLFDYYSGRIPRAPRWIREAGCEWIWRLRCEPTRLWRRYLLGNPLFLARVARERMTGSRSAAAAALQVDSWAGRRFAAFRSAVRMRMPAVRDRVLGVGKRCLDITASAVAILLLSPVLLGVALAIRVESSGSIVFRQRRVGRDGQPFTMFKFRSMFMDAEVRKAALMASNEMAGGVLFKMRDDPRVTRVGRFIRRTSIDELPQLFNVLRGDMSLVGPRPPLPSEVAQYTLKDRGRLGAAPGITCIWQVSGRSEIPFPQQVEMDLDYIQGQSLAGDVRLLLKTVPALVRGRGAY
jgi:exopolysaccharide biosynthesis WecB/TagA/CpsF family protein